MLFLAALLYAGSLLELVFGVLWAARPAWLLQREHAKGANVCSQGRQRDSLLNCIILSGTWEEPSAFSKYPINFPSFLRGSAGSTP